MNIVNVTPNNIKEETLFCIKDIKKPGFESKRQWFTKRYNEGLKLKILKNSDQKIIGFIEFVPESKAWRPVDAPNHLFIHCMYVYAKKDRHKGYGTLLINEAIKEAKAQNLSGLCVMCSDGSWIANKTIFIKLGFKEVDQRGRFQLLATTWDSNAYMPKLIDWTLQQSKYEGWHLVYADQCPWHEKSAFHLLDIAMEIGIDLKLTKIETAEAAKQAPSGFGVFNLLHDGKLLEDHYISATRFRNILKKELKIGH